MIILLYNNIIILGICPHPGISFIKIFLRKEDYGMKKYIAPEMLALSFAAEEAVSAPLEGSNTFNDGELEW